MAAGISSIKASKILRKFLEGSKIFIVDSSGGSRARLAGILIDLGASSSNIETFMNCDFARERFEEVLEGEKSSEHRWKTNQETGFMMSQGFIIL